MSSSKANTGASMRLTPRLVGDGCAGSLFKIGAANAIELLKQLKTPKMRIRERFFLVSILNYESGPMDKI